MYETFFGLQRRPFAATPDPLCWYAGGPYQAAIDELVVCAEQGQGIAMLVAPAGAGKTILCERLVRELSPRFDTVMLRHATFNTRRSLLQTLLCEMQQPFDKPTDQELRLGLAPVLRRLHQIGRALVVIVDEAHLLSESLLEELRILSDQAQEGKPLVRLILVGQPGLEEKLVHPSMQALNHRIRAQVILPTLTRQETADYLDYRFTWAGGRTEELLTPDAVDLICQAADGLPRCVNQLCDHAMLLAYAAETQPTTAEHVRAALEDLKHLSLPFQTISERQFPATTVSEAAILDDSPAEESCEATVIDRLMLNEPASLEIEMEEEDIDEPPVVPVYRLSAKMDATEDHTERLENFAAATPPAWQSGHVLATPVVTADFVEEVVIDRYTALDAGLTPPEQPAVSTIPLPIEVPMPAFATRPGEAAIPRYTDEEITWNAALTRLSESNEVAERLIAVQDALNVVTDVDGRPSPSDGAATLASMCPTGDRSAEDQIGTTVLEMIEDTRAELAASASTSESTVFEFGADEASPMTPAAPHIPITAEPRRYRNLFTMLRRKQQGRG